jgi:hypothetical protein
MEWQELRTLKYTVLISDEAENKEHKDEEDIYDDDDNDEDDAPSVCFLLLFRWGERPLLQ